MNLENKELTKESKKESQKEQKLCFEVSNVDEALSAASEQWGIPQESLHAEIVGTERGFLGLFGKKLQVEVRPVHSHTLLQGVAFINGMLERMGFEAEATIEEGPAGEVGGEMIEIAGADAAGYIVRRYGDCLKALEYLVNLAIRTPGEEPRMRLDSCGFRERRARTLEKVAESTAREALETGRPVRLEPMLSWERWIIHNALKDRTDVRTESVGEPPMRKVVVMPRFDEGYSSPRSRPRRRRY